MNEKRLVKINLTFIGVIAICFSILLLFFLFDNTNTLTAQDDFVLNDLIEQVETSIEYGQSRRYASFIIDSYLVNTDLLDKIKYHKNELLYIQIEYKENKSIEERRKRDYKYNIVLKDEYYRSLAKPYSYIYLVFSVLHGAEGYFSYQYFKELEKENINDAFNTLVSDLDSKYTKSYTNKDGETIQFSSDRYWLDLTKGKESIYEVLNLYPYGIFYRKVSLNYLYKYVLSKFPEDEEDETPEKYDLDTIDGYLYQLIDNLNNSERFDVTDFITKQFRFRG